MAFSPTFKEQIRLDSSQLRLYVPSGAVVPLSGEDESMHVSCVVSHFSIHPESMSHCSALRVCSLS